ncbi:non-classical arabinogalactan protein 31 [Cinnamomum micranthum f. kanehirae]|uniref:Non-classical arabinogalactan protein 31 n=1 Tax=Cinnamomum micranthum f. kanehirae TaxID=337451 RepID=A0A443PEH8_9MAGN|nr:non-classical arabinogalactan protein 31 [Cinnamomum micranthum f. kanehirae]
MAFVSVSLVKRLVAIQVCVVLMMGSFDSAQPLEGPEMDLDAATPSPQLPLRSIRRRIAVQGVVFCKSCNAPGFNPFEASSPLPGAIVSLVCNGGGKHDIVVEGKTDDKGYFFIQPEKVKTYSAHTCKVFLTSSPWEKCKKPTNINGGVSGDSLRFEKVLMGYKEYINLYSTGPFVFAPTSSSPCPRSP